MVSNISSNKPTPPSKKPESPKPKEDAEKKGEESSSVKSKAAEGSDSSTGSSSAVKPKAVEGSGSGAEGASTDASKGPKVSTRALPSQADQDAGAQKLTTANIKPSDKRAPEDTATFSASAKLFGGSVLEEDSSPPAASLRLSGLGGPGAASQQQSTSGSAPQSQAILKPPSSKPVAKPPLSGTPSAGSQAEGNIQANGANGSAFTSVTGDGNAIGSSTTINAPTYVYAPTIININYPPGAAPPTAAAADVQNPAAPPAASAPATDSSGGGAGAPAANAGAGSGSPWSNLPPGSKVTIKENTDDDSDWESETVVEIPPAPTPAAPPAGTNPPAPPAGTNPPAPPAGTNPPAPPAGTNPPTPPAADGTNPPAPPAGTNPPAPPAGTNPPAPPAGTNPPAPPAGTNPPAPPAGTNTPAPPAADGTTPPAQDPDAPPAANGTGGADGQNKPYTTATQQDIETVGQELAKEGPQFNKARLEAMARGEGVSAEVQQAASNLLNDPYALQAMTLRGKDGKLDGADDDSYWTINLGNSGDLLADAQTLRAKGGVSTGPNGETTYGGLPVEQVFGRETPEQTGKRKARENTLQTVLSVPGLGETPNADGQKGFDKNRLQFMADHGYVDYGNGRMVFLTPEQRQAVRDLVADQNLMMVLDQQDKTGLNATTNTDGWIDADMLRAHWMYAARYATAEDAKRLATAQQQP